MRPLRTSERILITVFGTMIFLLANFFVWRQVGQKRYELQAEIRKLGIEKDEAKFWLAQKDLWVQRKAWLDEKQPKMKGTGQESAELLEAIQESAKEKKITLGERTIIEPETLPYYTAIAVQSQAKGSLEAVTRWLASLQSPESFQAITSLTLKKDPESSNISCNLTVSRWYRSP